MTWYILIPAVMFLLMFILRIPIAFGMMAAGVFYFMARGQDIGLVASNVVNNLYSSYVIIAVPLFVFTAQVLNKGEITDKIFTFANTLLGRYRGGLAHVTVFASMIFSGMTGSAVAEASGLGKMEIETMRTHGYDAPFSAALAATASVMGPIIPPSIPLVIYAMLSGTSIGALFLGGVVPGILIGVFLMMYIVFIARKRNYPRGMRFTFRQFVVYTVKAFPALLTPAILLAGIYGGVMTPTEAGAVAGFYALILSMFVYRVLGWRSFFEILKETVQTVGYISLMVGASYVFSYIVAQEQVPNILAQWILHLTHNKYILFFAINILFLILGMFLDTSVITVAFIPIVLPLVEHLHIDLVQFGVVIVLNMMIGLVHPPMGSLLFIVSSVSNTPLGKVVKESLPMLVILLALLFLITFVPELVLWLPNSMQH